MYGKKIYQIKFGEKPEKREKSLEKSKKSLEKSPEKSAAELFVHTIYCKVMINSTIHLSSLECYMGKGAF